MFRFRLETILRYRRQLEDHEKRELGKVRSILAVENNKKVEFLQSSAQSGLVLDQKKESGTLTNDDFVFYFNFIEGIKRRVERQDLKIKKIAVDVEKQRKKVVGAMRNRQIFSTLRAHRHTEYLIEENRAEQKFIDETVSTRWKPREE
jgi:flagellar export protein FliJ